MTTGAGVDLILCGGSYNWFGLSNPSNSPYLVDYEGTKLLVNALLGASPSTAPTIAINHVIFISSSGVTPGAWRAAILDIALGNYSKWKAATEEYLLQSMRAAIPNVTIVRPGGLYDDPATKTVFPRPNIHTGDKMGWGPTSRTMVAQLCTDILGKHEAYRKIFELDDAKELDDRTNPQAILPTLGALSQIH
jgi:nucleoside-diphosphate-sugar epimerase